jgi:hypothetical protein
VRISDVRVFMKPVVFRIVGRSMEGHVCCSRIERRHCIEEPRDRANAGAACVELSFHTSESYV